MGRRRGGCIPVPCGSSVRPGAAHRVEQRRSARFGSRNWHDDAGQRFAVQKWNASSGRRRGVKTVSRAGAGNRPQPSDDRTQEALRSAKSRFALEACVTELSVGQSSADSQASAFSRRRHARRCCG